MFKSCIFMLFSTILTALFCPYIAHERTAQNLILSVRSLRFALFVKERHRSRNQGSLKSEERLSDFKERCAQLWVPVGIFTLRKIIGSANLKIRYLRYRYESKMLVKKVGSIAMTGYRYEKININILLPNTSFFVRSVREDGCSSSKKGK